MNQALEHDVKKWLLALSENQIVNLREYLQRILDYRAWSDDFGHIANAIPAERLYDINFSLDRVHEAYDLSRKLYRDIFDEPDMPDYTKIESQTPFYLEGEPQIIGGVFRNVYSLPCKELVQLIDDKQSDKYKLGLWKDGTVAPVGFKDDPFYVPSRGVPLEVMKVLIDNFGKSRLSAKEIITKSKLRHDTEGTKVPVMTADAISTAIRDINESFTNKSLNEEPLILGGSGFAFNRSYWQLTLILD